MMKKENGDDDEDGKYNDNNEHEKILTIMNEGEKMVKM